MFHLSMKRAILVAAYCGTVFYALCVSGAKAYVYSKLVGCRREISGPERNEVR